MLPSWFSVAFLQLPKYLGHSYLCATIGPCSKLFLRHIHFLHKTGLCRNGGLRQSREPLFTPSQLASRCSALCFSVFSFSC